MSSYTPLILMLSNHFEYLFEDLPVDLQNIVSQKFTKTLWDVLSPVHRKMHAHNKDLQENPELNESNQFWFDLYEKQNSLKNELIILDALQPSSIEEGEKKATKIHEIKQKISKIDLQIRSDLQIDMSDLEETIPIDEKFIPYPLAIKILEKKLNATNVDLAAWIWLGPKNGGLNAYLNANEHQSPKRFNYSLISDAIEDYISPLFSCWFKESDLKNFKAKEKFINGIALMDRWSVHFSGHAKSFIEAKIKESRLNDTQPIANFSNVKNEDYFEPSLETGIFSLTEILEIESTDLNFKEFSKGNPFKAPGHLDYDPEYQEQANIIAAEIKARLNRKPTRRQVAEVIAKKSRLKTSTVERRIRVKW